MKILTTISGREIRVTANKKNKTFTIRTTGGKFRTIPMSRQEFEHADWQWTGNDWAQFLKTDEYYKI